MSHDEEVGIPLPDLFLLMWSALLCEHVNFRPQTRENDQLLRAADRLGIDAVGIEFEAIETFNAANPETEVEKPAKAGGKKKALKTATTEELEEANGVAA